MIAENDIRLRFISLNSLEVPRDGDVVTDSWWAVHPDRGAVLFHESPQCNKDERVAALITPKYYPWAEIQHIPVAYVGDLFDSAEEIQA